MKARPVPGCQSMPWTLRWPLVNTSGLTLSERKSPVRRTLPLRLSGSWASAGSPVSPVVM